MATILEAEGRIERWVDEHTGRHFAAEGTATIADDGTRTAGPAERQATRHGELHLAGETQRDEYVNGGDDTPQASGWGHGAPAGADEPEKADAPPVAEHVAPAPAGGEAGAGTGTPVVGASE